MQIPIFKTIVKFLSQGITPEKLSLTFTLGVLMAIFPILGSHSMITIAIIFIFRLNPVVIFLITNVSFPLFFICFVPLERLGEWVSQSDRIEFSLKLLIDTLKSGAWDIIKTFSSILMNAVIGWFVAFVPAFMMLYYSSKLLFTKIASSMKNGNDEIKS